MTLPTSVQSVFMYAVIAVMLAGAVSLFYRRKIFSNMELSSCIAVSGVMSLIALYLPFMTKGLYVSAWIQVSALFLSILFGAACYWLRNRYSIPIAAVLLLAMYFLLR